MNLYALMTAHRYKRLGDKWIEYKYNDKSNNTTITQHKTSTRKRCFFFLGAKWKHKC